MLTKPLTRHELETVVRRALRSSVILDDLNDCWLRPRGVSIASLPQPRRSCLRPFGREATLCVLRCRASTWQRKGNHAGKRILSITGSTLFTVNPDVLLFRMRGHHGGTGYRLAGGHGRTASWRACSPFARCSRCWRERQSSIVPTDPAGGRIVVRHVNGPRIRRWCRRRPSQ